MKKKRRYSTDGVYLALGIGSVTMFFPFVWMIMTSSNTNAELLQLLPTTLPAQLT